MAAREGAKTVLIRPLGAAKALWVKKNEEYKYLHIC